MGILADDLHGCAVGPGGAVATTTDGGATWQPAPSNILHTTDGGLTWKPQYKTKLKTTLRDITFVDKLHG